MDPFRVRNRVANATANNTTAAPSVGDGSGPFLEALGPLGDVVAWLVAPEHVFIARLVASVLVFLGVGVLSKLARRSLEASARRTAQRQRLDDWKTRALVSRTRPLSLVINLGLLIVAFLTLLAVWGLQTAFVSLLTAAGFAGIVIGMAASNTLSNLIAGFIIFYNHPFDIGDWVEIEGTEGLVIDVKAGATVMETWDGEKVTFPNRVVEGARVRNMSHQRKLRRRFQIGIDYATDIEKAREILLDILKGHPEILDEPAPQVIATSFGDSSINLECRYWILPLRAAVVLIQTWIMQEIQRRFAKEGIVIPFPQRTLVYRYENGNPPPGDTVSTLAYDPEKDDRPIPAPPLVPNVDRSSPSHRQGQSPLRWINQIVRREPPRAEDTRSTEEKQT